MVIEGPPLPLYGVDLPNKASDCDTCELISSFHIKAVGIMEQSQNEIGECASEIHIVTDTQAGQGDEAQQDSINMHQQQQLHRGIKRDVDELHSSSSDHEDIDDTKIGIKPGKKTRGRVKIKMEYIDNKLRRYTTFSKRKTGIMKKVRVCQYNNILSEFCANILLAFCTYYSAQTLLDFLLRTTL